MEEKYFVVDNANKTKGEALTWKQLLYWCAMSIENYTHGRNPRTGRYEYFWAGQKTEAATAEFFKNFGHNENDGVWSKGYYKQEIDYVEMVERIPPPRWKWEPAYTRIIHYKNGDWVPPVFTPKRWMVIDSYGRVIPTSLIKSDYKKYTPCDEDKPPRKHRTKWYSRWDINHSWEYRKDPVPNIHKYKNGHWHEYRGNHGHTIQELRQYHRDVVERKEVQKEYGLRFKIHRNWMDLDPWNHGHHVGSKGKGWKRSRKEKQWMKHGWKRLYKVEE